MWDRCAGEAQPTLPAQEILSTTTDFNEHIFLNDLVVINYSLTFLLLMHMYFFFIFYVFGHQTYVFILFKVYVMSTATIFLSSMLNKRKTLFHGHTMDITAIFDKNNNLMSSPTFYQ